MPIEDWIETWRDPLTALAAGWGAGWSDAAEIAQDALVEGFLAREKLQGDPRERSVAGPWLRGIARRLYLARRRQTARLRPLAAGPVEPLATPQPEPVEDPRMLALRQAMAALPETLRVAVYLRYLGDSSNAEVAEHLGVSERAVEGRLRRARQRLAAVLSKEPEHEAPQ